MFYVINLKILKRLISKALVILLFFYSFQVLAVNDEGAGSVKDSISTSKQTCSLLVDWVNSDFKDKTFTIGFSNAARKCLAENKKAHDKLTENKQASIIETKNLGAFYSEKFKNKLLESHQNKYLNPCQSSSLDDFKKRALQTRFYASAAKIEAVNSNIVDEIAYYDSVLPSPYDSPLMGIDCKTAFLEINSKCVEYKKQTKDCKEIQSTRFENLIKKTKKNLARIGELEKLHRACLTKTRFKYNGQSPPNTQTNEKCKPLFQSIELIKDQIPWVRGEVFSSIALKTQPSYRNNYQTEYDEKKIVQAVSDQLHKNRQALVRTFNTNDKSFECLISNNVNDPECDFKKIRSHLASQPDVKASDIFTDDTKDGQEASLQLESDQCLVKYEDDLYQLHNTVKDVGYTVVLTAATLGVGWVSGLKAINSVSKLGRSLAIANGTFGAVASGVDLKHTHQECTQESKLVIDLSAKSNLTKENVCSDADSPLSQAQEKETDCLLGALLSAPGILPFLGSTPSLKRLASINRSAKSAERVSESVLRSNAQQMQDFVANKDFDGARALIRTQMKASGTSVNNSQVNAILKAHTDPDAICMIGKCTRPQLDKKAKIMKDAGLSEAQRRAAIERGLAGNVQEIKFVDGIADGLRLKQPLTPGEQVTKYKKAGDKLISDAGSDISKNQEAILSYYNAGKLEFESSKLKDLSTTEKLKNAISDYNLHFYDLSVDSRIRNRVRGGDFTNLAEEVSNLSKRLSQLPQGRNFGSKAEGKSYEALIKKEMEAMATEAQTSMNYFNKSMDQYPEGGFEAWQFMRARIELARYQWREKDMDKFEAILDQANNELESFIKKYRLENKVKVWEQAERELLLGN